MNRTIARTAATYLQRVLEILSSPDRYTTDSQAVMADGRQCLPNDLRAVKWSLTGALWRAAGPSMSARAVRGRDLAASLMLSQAQSSSPMTSGRTLAVAEGAASWSRARQWAQEALAEAQLGSSDPGR